MSQATPVAKQVLVLGASSEAARAVKELLALGYKVLWVSGDGLPSNGLDSPALAKYANCRLYALEGHVGRFVSHFLHQGQRLALSTSAIIVATGNERYFPAERYGLELSSLVWTTSQVKEQLKKPLPQSVLAFRDKRILLLLDWSGETSKELVSESFSLAGELCERCRSEVYFFYSPIGR